MLHVIGKENMVLSLDAFFCFKLKKFVIFCRNNKNRFAIRKKLSRKQRKSQINSFLSIYQVNDDIIKIEENQNFQFDGHFLSHVTKCHNWRLKKALKSFLQIPWQNSMKYKWRIYNLFNKNEPSDLVTF